MAATINLSGNTPAGAPNIDPTLGDNMLSMRPDYSREAVLAFTTASAQAPNFDQYTHTVRIAPTAACFYRTGTGALTATTADAYLAAGVVEYIDVNPGDGIAALRSTADGNLSIVPMNKRSS